MSRVDFYEATGRQWEATLCRVVEQAWEAGTRVYVWAASEAQARDLDGLLWTFRDESFVPHGLWQGEASLDEPVAVGWKPGNPNGAACLVLARDASPAEVGGFARVVDFAAVDVPPLKEAGRNRYRAFQQAGFAVTFHPSP